MELLAINNLKKTYKNLEVLKNISFSVNKGEFISILGASGCGKTTLLRLIAGLEKCDSGSIEIEGKDAAYLSAVQRNIGMVSELLLVPQYDRLAEYYLCFKKQK